MAYASLKSTTTYVCIFKKNHYLPETQTEADEISVIYFKIIMGRKRGSEALLKLFSGYVGVYIILLPNMFEISHNKKTVALSICSFYFVKCQDLL